MTSKKRTKEKIGKKAQATIFIIIAIVIIGAILLLVLFKQNLFGEDIHPELQGVYDTYAGCIEQETRTAISILGSQGGRITLENYEQGNDQAPLGNQLNFLGIQIPYWYVQKGNLQTQESIPTKTEMQEEIEQFLEQKLNNCDLERFYEQGISISLTEPTAKAQILEQEVRITINADLTVSQEEKTSRKTEHTKTVQTQIGSLYETAKQTYNTQKEQSFLENYAIDVMHNYAPVDGVEIQCNPKIWKTPEVVQNLQEALSANLQAIKFEGNYHTKNDEGDDYFTVKETVKNQINYYYLPNEFPSKIEITPASQALMTAEPVGNQEGLGIMGFCYVPYHFVYDISFGVLAQVTNGEETFQYPINVIIKNNQPLKKQITPLQTEQEEQADICAFAESQTTINTYDTNLNGVEADITYKCFNTQCSLGKTIIQSETGIASLETKMPACVNGYLTAKAEGYAETKIIHSSNSQETAELILDKEHEVEVEIRMNGQKITDKTAMAHFKGTENSVSAIIPENQKIKLKEDLYDLEVYIYGNANVNIPGTTKTECYETTSKGLLGLFGNKKEECVKIEIPPVKIEQTLLGGGKTTTYLLENQLTQGKIIIEASELPTPTTIEQLQYNYEVFETLGVQLQTENA